MAEARALAAPRWHRALPPLLRERPAFRTFFLGQSVSLVGDQGTMLALPLVAVLAIHADAAQMGYPATAALLPTLLLSLHAGAWVDRRGSHRKTMLVADLGRAVLIVTVPVAAWLGVRGLGQLYVVAFLTGALGVFFFVSYQSMFVSLVPRERFVEGHGLLNGSRALSYVAGPSIAGALVQAVTAPAALVLDAGSFLVSAATLGRLGGSRGEGTLQPAVQSEPGTG